MSEEVKERKVYENTPKGVLIDHYREDMYNILHRSLPLFQPFELEEAINYSINKRFQDHPVVIDNNYTKRKAEIELLDLANQLLEGKYIMTTSGVLFQKHGTVKNPFYNFIQYLVDKRDEAKSKMKQYDKGTEEYNKYNLQQLNYKVSCNALYGCAGNWSSVFYNLFLATAVTGQGRGCISASITMFEGFLANNVKFHNLNEVHTFMNNICEDQKKPEMHRFYDYDYLDRNVTIEEAFLRIIRNCDWPFSDLAKKEIWNYMNNLSQRELNIIYYKNNLYEFCKNKKIMDIILTILKKLNTPFLDPNKPNKEIVAELVLLKDLLFEYVYYRHLWIDKLDRVHTMIRDVVLITDTDSCIVSLDEWYKFVKANTIGIPMTIKYTYEEILEHTDKVILDMKKAERVNEYDFYNDRLVEAKRLKYPMVIIEEDNLRYSIINIMSYVVSQLILDYMVLFSENYNTYSPDRDCLLIMKNEFLFKSMLITSGKKNYTSLQLVQEGRLVPDSKQFDIKGMPIDKVGIPESTANRLKTILEYNVLRTDFVDQVDIIKSLAALEKEICLSLENGDKTYYKPARIKSIGYYDDPMRIQGIKASVAYNEIKSKDEEPIDLNERNTVLIIKVVLNRKNADKISKDFPEHYIRLSKLLERKEFKDGISSIAIPYNAPIPKWIVPFIDYTTIIQDNIKVFPIEELGISRENNSKVTHTNIVSF